MKNRSIILALVVSIGLFATSCNNDSNGGETLAPLSGKWDITKDPPQNQSGCDKDFLNLKLDNTVVEGDYDSTISPCALSTKNGIYSRSHNNLTTVINGISKTQDIVNLTLTQLKLKDATGAISQYTRN